MSNVRDRLSSARVAAQTGRGRAQTARSLAEPTSHTPAHPPPRLDSVPKYPLNLHITGCI